MENLLGQGIELAIFGMGTVFVFLTLLIFVTKTMSAMVLKYQPVQVESAASGVRSSASPNDGELVAVIAAAIRQHRQKSQ